MAELLSNQKHVNAHIIKEDEELARKIQMEADETLARE